MAPEKAPLRVVLCFYPDQPQDDIALGLAQRAWPSAFLRFPTVHRLEPEGRLRVVLPGRHAVGEWPLFACAVRRRRFPVGASPTRRSLQPEATGAVMEVTKWLKPSV
jgi:hypothetical protein